MGEWQNGELAGNKDIVYLIGMWQNLEGGEPVGSNLQRWQDEVGFTGTAMLLDYGMSLMNEYADANPGPQYTNSLTVMIDKTGVIRDVNGTYEEEEAATLALLQQLAAE
ncbi:MAG: hypothetical protein AAF721_12810 [Myxococcota bacterium]